MCWTECRPSWPRSQRLHKPEVTGSSPVAATTPLLHRIRRRMPESEKSGRPHTPRPVSTECPRSRGCTMRAPVTAPVAWRTDTICVAPARPRDKRALRALRHDRADAVCPTAGPPAAAPRRATTPQHESRTGSNSPPATSTSPTRWRWRSSGRPSPTTPRTSVLWAVLGRSRRSDPPRGRPRAGGGACQGLEAALSRARVRSRSRPTGRS